MLPGFYLSSPNPVRAETTELASYGTMVWGALRTKQVWKEGLFFFFYLCYDLVEA